MTRGNSRWPTRPLPDEGAFRVAKDPFDLPAGPWPAGTGAGRYDDPYGLYAVWYVGGSIDCCLKEVLDRSTRRDDAFEARIADYGALPDEPADDEDDDLDAYPMPPGADPSLDDYDGWLPALNVGRVTTADDAPLVVVDHEDVLGDLDGHDHVRAALDLHRAALGVARLTRALVRGKRRLVYKVTQAVSSAIHHHEDRYGGVAYTSCVDESEQCWGVYSRVQVVPASPRQPILDGGEVEAALRRAATYVGITLPEHLFTS